MKRQRLLWMLVAAALCLALSGSATTLKRMDLDELTHTAQTVARVKCIANEARWEGNQVYTFTTFEVLETLKGSTLRQIIVRLPGGKVGHLIARVDGVPRFVWGEEAFLFLEPTSAGDLSVTSWVQGTFRVRGDQKSGKETVTQDTGAVSIFDPATRRFKPGGVRNMAVEEFRGHVRGAVERQRLEQNP